MYTEPKKFDKKVEETFIEKFEVDFTGRITKTRPFCIYDHKNHLSWKEILPGASSGHRSSDPPFTSVKLVKNSLRIYDRTDILRDQRRDLFLETKRPITKDNWEIFIFEATITMMKGYRGSGYSFASCMIDDGKNRMAITRGHDKFAGIRNHRDYNAQLCVNNKILYDKNLDSIKQPKGWSTIKIKIINTKKMFSYWVNGKNIYKNPNGYIPFKESKIKICLSAMRWNWKGPIHVHFQDIKFTFIKKK